MRTRLVFLFLALSCIGSAFVPPIAQAQDDQALPEEFDTGSDSFKLHVYLRMAEAGAPAVLLFPGQGTSGVLFRDRPDGEPSWFDLLQERNFSALTVDWSGSGKAPEPFNQDYIRALKGQIEGAFAMGRGSLPRLAVAHSESAALLIKVRSFGDYTSRTAVLIDPIGPQHSQPLETISFEEALIARDGFEETLWKRLGFGPHVGELHPGLDIDAETAMSVFESYDRHALQFRPALLQPMISPIRVRGPGRIRDWYVLIVRTPAADEVQISREQALTAWLRDAGANVELLDLNAEPEFAGTTGMPWIGTNAEALLDRMIEWYKHAVILAPESRDLTGQAGS